MEERRQLLAGIDLPDIDRLDVYRSRGGYEGARRAAGLSPEAVAQEVEASGLRGRGGAWRPVGERWRRLRGGAGAVVVDALEPEPGRFRDRKLAERLPHRILEGALIAARAVGARAIYLCVRADASRARRALAAALQEAATAGLLGPLQVHLHPVPGPLPVAAGDSLALQLVEGGRPEPRADDGTERVQTLFGEPALVHTASTLGYLPAILSEGTDARTSTQAWTQVFCISGHVRRPGLYEVGLGDGTFADLVDGVAGGVRAGRQLKFVLHGGYGSHPVLRPGQLGRPLDPSAWQVPGGGALDGDVGTGAVIVADDTVCAVDTARLVAGAFAATACGLCLPCREGTAWLAAALDRLEGGQSTAAELHLMRERCAALTPALALCGHGALAARAVGALADAFAAEFAAHLEGACPVAKDLTLKAPESIHVRY